MQIMHILIKDDI